MPTYRMYISNNTEIMIHNEREQSIINMSKRYNVEESLTRAIIQEESKNSFSSIRFEPCLKKAKWYLRLLTDEEKEHDFSFCSYGLMQVLFGIAKHHGFKGRPFDLINPNTNIAYGLEYLNYLIRKYYYLDKVLSCYNGGEPIEYNNKGKFKNYKYVNRVMLYYINHGGNPVNVPEGINKKGSSK